MMRSLAIFGLAMGCANKTQEPSKAPAVVEDGARDGSLRVLSYNVHGLPSIITGDDTPGRLAQIAPLLTDWDLVGLQEDWDASNHASMLSQAGHPEQHWFDARVGDDRVYGSGLTALSANPVVEQNSTHYTTCYGLLENSSDCLASKGFQALRLKLGAGEIDFYNTHLEAGGGEEDNAARASQVEQLIAALNGWSANKAIVFTGDFNLHADDPEDAPLLARLSTEANLQDSCTLVDCEVPNHIDKIFLRDSPGMTLIATEWADESAGFLDPEGVDLSDHPPISTNITWSVTQ
jgi:endonuclease/exonuclease/phosphatase family metal-dependent hydrolase